MSKGQNGKVMVFGGCLEYTGAPYFSAISALRVGADLAFIVCTQEASIPIKCYSPEIICLPYLPCLHSKLDHCLDLLLKRADSFVIGPGLGRDPITLNYIIQVILKLKSTKKPVILDADALYLLSTNLNLTMDLRAVLTPNKNELKRLYQATDTDNLLDLTKRLQVCILAKGKVDEICSESFFISSTTIGGTRRYGGQGDILAGVLGKFLINNNWKKMLQEASDLVRKTSSSNAIEHINNLYSSVFGAR